MSFFRRIPTGIVRRTALSSARAYALIERMVNDDDNPKNHTVEFLVIAHEVRRWGSGQSVCAPAAVRAKERSDFARRAENDSPSH
jgi:hypothetical protein